LVLLVNDSEYSKSADAKSILSPVCIYLVFLGALENGIPGRKARVYAFLFAVSVLKKQRLKKATCLGVIS
jgi:hypothetical protein